ncbi:hypothetical protein [Actinophytocola sediminis]
MHTESEPRRSRLAVIVTVVVVVAFLAAATTLIVVLSQKEESAAGPSAPTSTSAVPPSTASTTPTPASSPQAVPTFDHEPLWPFTSLAEVEEWQAAHQSTGQDAWHLDPRATAVEFTTGYLGFTGIDQVLSATVEDDEAWVTVGFPIENAKPGTAAVVHLARFGAGADAPWEVVGTRDTTLTLTEPGYGEVVSSPFTVGGRITGVDEDIKVRVRQPDTAAPLGEAAGVPAGGESTPWSTQVSITGATAPALTVVAWSGGHVVEVERFAITAVRVR